MMHLISLNELVLPKFFILLFLGRDVKILRVAPIIPKLKGFFQRIADKAVDTGRAQYAIELVPELKEYWDFERRFYFEEVFKKYEPWQNRYYDFECPQISSDPIYGYGFKQMTCSYTFWKVIEIYLLNTISRNLNSKGFKVHGVMADTIALGCHRFGDKFAENMSPLTYPKILLNILLAMVSILFTVTWIVTRIRPFINIEKFDVAFDRMGDNREYELLKEIASAGKFLLVERSPASNAAPLPDGMQFHICRRTDGVFSILGAGRAITMTVLDVIRLLCRHWQTPPGLLYEMLSLPYKRLLVRGLMNRFRPNAYIGRDEYNVDHVMRRAELSFIGVNSIGISGGLFPCFSSLAPNVRYVSFDTYYVYAAPLFEQYHETWAKNMQVKTIGSYSISREQQLKKFGRNGENILFTMRVAWNRPEMVRMVRAVAKAFPNRNIYLQFKRGFVSSANVDRLVKECETGLDNVFHTTEDVYALLPKAKYHISDISTFVAEAICSGMTTLLADLLDQEFNCYRLFPGLALKTAEDLVDSLKALEKGEKVYPRQAYFKMLGYRQGEVGFDLLRDELGIDLTHA